MSQKSASRWKSHVVLLVLAAAALIPLRAHPAAAASDDPPAEAYDKAGTGQLEGTELVEDETGFPCFRMTRSLFSLRGAGTYEGRTTGGNQVVFRGQVADGQRLYSNGPIRLQIENTAPYYHGPFGTHGTDASGGAGCSPSTTGSPIPAEFLIFGAETAIDTDGDQKVDVLGGQAWIYKLDGTGQKVPCTAQGTFARGTPGNPTFADPTWKASWTLDSDCTVVGNGAGVPGTGVAPRGTFQNQHGKHEPCFNAPCTDNFEVDYSEFIPKPGPYLALTGPDASGTTCQTPVALTARLTVTGWPQPNVPVTFTVSGPAPGAPPAGAGITAADGTAAFSFRAAVPGDYVVTAQATYNGEQRTATHTVHFTDRPPLSLALTGPTNDQTDDPITVTATATNPCAGPMAGVSVHFTVAATNPPPAPWLVPGTATPATGDAVTGQNVQQTGQAGQATFTFTGDRAGEYLVTATTSPASVASDTHTVRLDIGAMRREGAIDIIDPEPPGVIGVDPPAEVTPVRASVIDPAGRFGYFEAESGSVAKVDLASFQRIGNVTLKGPAGESLDAMHGAAIIDPAGRYAYFGTAYDSLADGVRRGGLAKVDLNSPGEPSGFKQVGFLTFERGETMPATALITPAGTTAYIGTEDTSRVGDGSGWLVKVDLASFQRTGAIKLEASGQTMIPKSTVMDTAGHYAYVGAQPARILKVDLTTFQLTGDVALTPGIELYPVSAVIDPANHYAYFGTDGTDDARVVRIDLATLQRTGAIDLPPDEGAWGDFAQGAVIDPSGDFAYFGSSELGTGKKVTRIDLRTFTRSQALALSPDPVEKNLISALLDPSGNFVYFGTESRSALSPDNTRPSEKIVKVRVRRPTNSALVVGDDSYSTPYATPVTVAAPGVLANDHDAGDGDPLVALSASDPAGGSVVLNPNGSFTYSPNTGFAGVDTFTYAASDGKDYSARATVSVTVAPPPGLTGSAFGYDSSVSLFGGPPGERGPAPTIALARDGSNSPQDAHLDSAEAVYGPAVIFKSGPIDVHAEGAMSPRPHVMVSAAVQGFPDAAQRPGPLLYDGLASTCTASSSGRAASVSVSNGVVETKYDPATQEPIEFNHVPANPPPGYTVDGTIDYVGDSFRIVFNEQVLRPDHSITVVAAHMYLLGPSAVGDLFIGRSVCGAPSLPSLKPPADFDGDGSSDVAVYRPSTQQWFVRGGDVVQWGADGDIPVAADYDGDGKTDVAVFRPSNGQWFVRGGLFAQWGTAGDVPVPADYDGDGKADIAVYRPSTGQWFVRGGLFAQFGADGDVPVPGDYDGDGKVDLAVFRPSTQQWFVRGGVSAQFGADGDVPVPGDYDGDGRTDIAVFRSSTQQWFVYGGAVVQWGASGDVAVPGDYDGDGRTDIAVFRPSTQQWFDRSSGLVVQWGTGGDRPLALRPGQATP